MSATQALKNAAFGRSPAWPDSDTRPDLQTLRGRFLRRLHLSLFYGLWVHGDPVYTFGEEYAYHTFPYLLKLRLKLNEFKIPGVFFFGLPHCFFLPRTDVDLITVVGEALVLPRIEQPTKEDVQKYHGQYVEALQKLTSLFS
ncbi:uncharacterized protein PITG_08465 [Phytophthora infestans T30-4]|uniref:diacylglycerol O-acyltransferase n=1 Tax=Phytophthora infestans (strain T30-4) TaxID=403677 RepID=D0NAP1_PHYIT|nr:uncharacterized protein PITG_08465 [Phytophthora infestans T30-4]EEY54899.1 conserved hypothetical protein [Phytophthora infestans T30-4]|eukprot:XP_002903844.1 conserved hypothetical protein [Phytophthora infestans T30-4]